MKLNNFKKMYGLLCLLLIAGLSQAQVCDLITNPGFTADLTGATIGSDMHVANGVDQDRVLPWYKVVSTPDIGVGLGNDGTDCIRLRCPSDGLNQEAVGQDINMVANGMYQISFWYNLSQGSTNKRFQVRLEDANLNSTVLMDVTGITTNGWVQFQQNCYIPTQNWTKIVFQQIHIPANAGTANTRWVLFDNVHINPLGVNAIADNNNLCVGATANLSDNFCSGVGNVTYQWVDLSTGNTIGNTAQISVTPPVGTWNYRLIKSFSGSCTMQDDIAITVNPLPTLTTQNLTVCSGNAVTLNATSNGTLTNWSNGMANPATFTPVASSSVCISATNTFGCSVTSCSNITVNQSPTVNAGNNVFACAGNPVTLTATSPDPGVTFAWSNGQAGATNSISSSNATYTATVTAANGCTASDNVDVSTHVITVEKSQLSGAHIGTTTAYTYQLLTYEIKLCNNTNTAQTIPLTDHLPSSFILDAVPAGCTLNGLDLTGSFTVAANDCYTITCAGRYYVWSDENTACIAQPPNVVEITDPVCGGTLSDQTDLCINFGCWGNISITSVDGQRLAGEQDNIRLYYYQHKRYQDVTRIAFRVHYPDFLSIVPENEQTGNFINPAVTHGHITIQNEDVPSQADYKSADIIVTFDPVTIGDYTMLQPVPNPFNIRFRTNRDISGLSQNMYDLFVHSLSSGTPNMTDLTVPGLNNHPEEVQVLTQIGLLEIDNLDLDGTPTADFTYVVDPCSQRVFVTATETDGYDRWEFNDPEHSFVPIWGGEKADWQYMEPGTYTINHYHIDMNGVGATLSKQITIAPMAYDYPNGLYLSSNSTAISDVNTDGVIRVRGPVTMAQGLNYQITNKTIEFADDLLPDPADLAKTHSGIIVPKATTLTLNNAHLRSVTGCPTSMWQGIQVFGDDEVDNGKLIMDGSNIVNARIGVALYKVNVAFNDETEYGGAILEATSSTFRNNNVSVGFKANDVMDNASVITACTFDCTGKLKDVTRFPDQGITSFISLEKVKGVSILANSFIGLTSLGARDRGTGIISYDASYTVKSSNVGATLTPNSFTDLTVGMDIYSSGGIDKVVRIKDNRFSNVSQGITNNGSSLDEVSYNVFDIPLGRSTLDSWGMNLYNSSGFLVTQNTFNSPSSNQYTFGVISRNTASVSGRIYKNIFAGNFHAATQTEQDNAQLEIKCNTYSGTNTYDWAITSGNLSDQGTCGSNTSPAGNVFASCTASDQSQIYKNPGVAGFTYNAHSNRLPVCVSSGVTVVNCQAVNSNSCPAIVSTPASGMIISYTASLPEEREARKSAVVKAFVQEDNIEGLLGFLTQYQTPEDLKMIIPLHLERGNYVRVRALLNEYDRTTAEGDNFFRFYDILTTLGETGRKARDLTDAERFGMEEVSNSNTFVSVYAESFLANVDGLSLVRIPERTYAVEEYQESETAVHAEDKWTHFNIYPNPSEGDFNIRFENSVAGQLTICDALGRVFYKADIDAEQNSLLTTSLRPGVYIVHFTDVKGQVETKQLLVK